jgi:Cu+-exporting ATPase
MARASSEVASVACAKCGAGVDPLRAERVAVYGERFRYFCSAGCYANYDPRALLTPLPLPSPRDRDRERSSSPPLPAAISESPREATRVSEPAVRNVEPAAPREPNHEQSALRELALVGRETETQFALGLPPEPDPSRSSYAVAPLEDRDAPVVGTLLLVLAAVGGALGIALILAGTSQVALTARLVLAAVATGALAAEAWMGERDPTSIGPLALLAAPVGGVGVALVAYVTGSPSSASAVTLSALVTLIVSVSTLLVRRARRPLDLERQEILSALDGKCQRVVGDDVVEARSLDLRPGEEIVLEAGDTAPVDAIITAGTAVILPWRGAAAREERREGDVIVAGARLVEGRLRAIVSWAGPDRAWIRLSSDLHRRADLHSSVARAGRLVAERISPFLTGGAALAAFASNYDWIDVGILAVGVHAALVSPALASIPAQHVARAILNGLRRGVAFRSAEGFDRAGKVSTLAFCARGTLLLGEPEVADIEGFGDHRPAEVLALVAGAESGAQHATGTAVLRAARARGLRPDGVRSPNPQPGLGTMAVASSGQALVVGSRALMLREHVSVAAVESRITELEAMGRNVLLVALGGRLVGLLGLQDGLRPGARAAVQHLLDIGVEPVLLSGDARETCEALGHALDIDHIRPELAPAERADAIRRLMDGGAVVAVLGRSPADDLALGAGDASIALATAGSTTAEWNVQLASDDVRDAAFALRLAHEARREARLAFFLALIPGALASLAATLGLVTPALAPLGAALGGALALLRLRIRR